MTTARTTTGFWLGVLVALGLGVRLYYFAVQSGFHYPDEIYQYLEPAFAHSKGYGFMMWEFERGARNFVLPAYYGAWMELGSALGLAGDALVRFLWLHNAVVSLVLIPLCMRLGKAVARGDDRVGLLTAALAALFPPFAYFAPHTLSECPGLLVTTFAYVLWLENVAQPNIDMRAQRRSALLIGCLLGLAIILRYTLIVFLPLVLIDLALRARRRLLPPCLGGVALAMAVLAAVDWMTWGGPLHSLVEYVRYNWIEGGNIAQGRMPTLFYLRGAFIARLGLGGLALSLLAIARPQPRLTLAWLIPLLIFSAIPHKEERFILSIWPFVLAAFAVGVSALVRQVADATVANAVVRRQASRVVPLVLATTLAGFAFVGVKKLPFDWCADTMAAQDLVGAQPDASGLLFQHGWNDHGGYLMLHRNIPQAPFDPALLEHRLFNYVAVREAEWVQRLSKRPDFAVYATLGKVVVFRRRPPPSGR